MRKTVLCILFLLMVMTLSLSAQELVIPFPEGGGYAIKKEIPTEKARWELKVVNQQGQFGLSERTIVNPESFYAYEFPEGMQEMEFDPTDPETATMDAEYFERLKTVPIRRHIQSPETDLMSVQVDAFLDAYNQMLRNSPADEPITLVIDKAAWQYWFNQMSLWEQYVRKEVFLETDIDTKIEDSLDFTTREALNTSVATLAEELRQEAIELSAEEHLENLMFLYRLQSRENRRKDYRQWLEDQQQLVVEFAEDYLQRQQGRKITIEGTVYLLSEEPLERAPRDAVNLVTDNLTPYDLLNSDGTLKKPEE